MFKLLPLACLVFGFIDLHHSQRHRFNCLVSTVIESVCLMKPASKDRVGGMAVNAFLLFKIVAFLWKGGVC